MNSPSPIKPYINSHGPQFQLIEDNQIIFLKHEGDVDLKKATIAMEGILHYLNQTDQILHLISDMREARLLPEAGEIRSSALMNELQNHPKLGIQTMVVREKRKDYALEKIMDEYNITVSRNKIVSLNGEYKRHVIYFSSLEEAKTFLVTYNDTWEML
jgi:hypothetical protein